MSATHPENGASLDLTNPSMARIYDVLLDGKDHQPADRIAAADIIQRLPNVKKIAQANRAFLGRAVTQAAQWGIDQYLDIGSGLPTQQNVHQVAQAIRPGSRVVYVDRDPQVLTHAHALLGHDTNVAVVGADMRDPAGILNAPQTRSLLTPTRPVAVLLVSVLHFLADADDPHQIVHDLMRPWPNGSLLILSHAIADPQMKQVETLYRRDVVSTATVRSRQHVNAFFDGFTLLNPGLVDVELWRPNRPVDPGVQLSFVAGVAAKQ